MNASLFAAVLSLLVAQSSAPERTITEAVLRTYFAETQGGTGIAFPEQRRPVRLADRTIVPSAEQLKVHVFSPENKQAETAYRVARANLAGDLVSRSIRTVALDVSVPHFALERTRRYSCGPRTSVKYSDAVAVSRPGLSRAQDEAVLYLEYSGGARAYYLRRINGQWAVIWHVELWACG